jgi:hypothetical protein
MTVSGCGVIYDFSALRQQRIDYLLGLYLGDGCVSRCRRARHLRANLDKKYPRIVDRCRAAIDALLPAQHASIMRQPTGCVVVSS